MTTNEVFPRPLTHTEEALLRFMLGVAGDDVEPLRARVADLWVTGLCPCGCPTVLLAPHGDLRDPEADEAEALFTETVTKPGASTIPHELLLFVHPTGWPSSLELVTHGDATPTEFPPVEVFDPPQRYDRPGRDVARI